MVMPLGRSIPPGEVRLKEYAAEAPEPYGNCRRTVIGDAPEGLRGACGQLRDGCNPAARRFMRMDGEVTLRGDQRAE